MKCSKCGHENPEDTLFCEACDWKLNETYIPDVKVNPIVYGIIALVLGLASVVMTAMNIVPIAAFLIGAVGLFLGGYAVNIPRIRNVPNKNVCVAVSAVGLFLSVLGFFWALALLVL